MDDMVIYSGHTIHPDGPNLQGLIVLGVTKGYSPRFRRDEARLSLLDSR